jgi:hypothetical protein
MRPYLVCHDYGMGGLWWWIVAPSADAIRDRYRDVSVFDEPPSWWDDEMDRQTPRYELDDEPDSALKLLAR